ncbi:MULTISPECIES: DNA polymerase III subunit gamma/tau [Psychrilyobacter]|uniref:DNA polymerase III subunit gamma/tau n=1 Tax=Psychrilyobacter piezotolerans TaxID=2293438 RepID=A0ABX9KK19_9FUSO|nr:MULTISPECIES: DNA polymerase III subunit gamma/tau [Psychrilyobacter]MCS5421432.1 DNA polymerase III subunit gamma/tau [Psychrilyobacter sp. S5]NDI76586.1 DNA polymerase III subunit gamma/tau [Psychrilyobacter piezotolerans]RDE65218.1 DNA polymerase III subunit gamma/tau [Psychrilyobacter sp. S5]REI42836.1 DNA polymerase III subunit gamma/tau [Psychrilyobacter piezotolerans]
MHITLYRKYRPSTFEEVAGETDIIKTIKNSLKENKMAHAYLFTGPRGVGKTTTARLIAKGLNCMENGVTDTPCNRCENCIEISKNKFIDLIEIDAASNRGIDEIRSLKDKINYQPAKGRKKVYIIDEVHMLTKEAFNALLKTLEEPPAHVIFILATTEPDKILETIISRCQRYDFKPVNLKESMDHLLMIAKSEGVEIDDPSLKLIYEKSGGSMRDAISIFEKLISSCYGEGITLEKTEKILGVIPEKKLAEFLEIIRENDLVNGINFLDDLWNDSINVEEFLKSFAYYLKELMIEKKSPFNIMKSIAVIEDIFEVMGKFRYEEDKRILGYVILHKIGAIHELPLHESPVQEKIVEKIVYVEKEVSAKSEETGTIHELPVQEKTVDISIEDVRTNWNDLVNEAKRRKMPLISFLSTATPTKIEDGILHIGFYAENRFHKESMEKPYYNDIFLGVLKDKFGGRVVVKYDLLNEKNKVVEDKSDFVERVVDFFDGELI